MTADSPERDLIRWSAPETEVALANSALVNRCLEISGRLSAAPKTEELRALLVRLQSMNLDESVHAAESIAKIGKGLWISDTIVQGMLVELAWRIHILHETDKWRDVWSSTWPSSNDFSGQRFFPPTKKGLQHSRSALESLFGPGSSTAEPVRWVLKHGDKETQSAAAARLRCFPQNDALEPLREAVQGKATGTLRITLLNSLWMVEERDSRWIGEQLAKLWIESENQLDTLNDGEISTAIARLQWDYICLGEVDVGVELQFHMSTTGECDKVQRCLNLEEFCEELLVLSTAVVISPWAIERLRQAAEADDYIMDIIESIEAEQRHSI